MARGCSYPGFALAMPSGHASWRLRTPTPDPFPPGLDDEEDGQRAVGDLLAVQPLSFLPLGALHLFHGVSISKYCNASA